MLKPVLHRHNSFSFDELLEFLHQRKGINTLQLEDTATKIIQRASLLSLLKVKCKNEFKMYFYIHTTTHMKEKIQKERDFCCLVEPVFATMTVTNKHNYNSHHFALTLGLN